MPQIASSLGSIASSPATTDVLNAASTGYNLYNQYQQQQYQNTLRSDAQNPAKVTALAQQYTQPLNAGLTAAVNNATQAQLAQSGLSESPQIAQQVEAQAIAPYIQNNQQQGYNLALQALGLGGGAIPPGQQQQTGMAALAKAFSQLPNANGGSGGGGGTPTGPYTLPALLNNQSQIPNPYSGIGATPGYIDPSGLGGGGGAPDLSDFYTPDYSVTDGSGG